MAGESCSPRHGGILAAVQAMISERKIDDNRTVALQHRHESFRHKSLHVSAEGGELYRLNFRYSLHSRKRLSQGHR